MDKLIEFAYDQNLPLDIKDETKPQHRMGTAVRDISFSNALGGRVAAYLILPPPEIKPPYAGMVWAHWLEPESHDSNRTQFLDEAVELSTQGVVSILPDGFWSTSPKRWAEKPVFWWKTEAKHDTELSARQVVEIRRALDALLAQDGVDAKRIGYVGHDFGGMYGTLIAGVDKRPKFYALMAVTTTFSEWFMFGSKLSAEDQQTYIKAMAPLDPIKYVAKAAPASMFFQFAHADYFVPERTAQMYFDAASEPKEIKWYDAGHDVKHDEARPDRMRWVRQQLGLNS